MEAWFGALCAFAIILLPLIPRAEEATAVIAVAPSPGPTPALADLTAQLRRSLSDRAPGVIDAAELRARMGAAAAMISLTDTDATYEKARDLELRGDPLAAINKLEVLLQQLEAYPESPEAFKQWSRAMLRLAKLESQLSGHEERTHTLLEKLLRADPLVRVDAGVYGAEVAQLSQSVRAQLGKLDQRRLTLTSPADGVRFYVNGRDVGTNAAGPMVVTVPAGVYQVTGHLQDIRFPAVSADLTRQDGTVAMDFSVVGLLRPAQGPGLVAAPDDTTAIFAAAKLVRAKTVVATHLVQSQSVTYLVGSAYDVEKGKLEVAGVMHLVDQVPPAGGVNALADFLLTGENNAKGPVKIYDPARTDWKLPPSKTKGWIAFTSAVGFVGLAGASVWQFTAASQSDGKAKDQLVGGNLPPDRTLYDRYRSQAKNQRATATATGVGAGVCLASSLVLGYLSYKQTGEVGPIRF